MDSQKSNQVNEPKNINPFQMLIDNKGYESWEKDLIYRSIGHYLQFKETNDMLVRVQKKDTMPNDAQVLDLLKTKLYPEEKERKNIFYFANQHNSNQLSINSKIKYEQSLKKCKRRKYLFWKKYANIPPQTNELQQTRDQINQQVRQYKIPTLAGFFAVSLGITFLMKLNLNPMSHRVSVMVTGLSLGYFYSDFKNSDQIFASLPELQDQNAENEKIDIFNYCYSLDPSLMAKGFNISNISNFDNQQE
ncbi:hypothetical protein PPERSA_11985 [Pseudocohnilembus persalinus]|uniref:Transmembrane protein n=1 Tax=Pseudocohnilembus persalinus TaxID=266149 RepID=A0A0V0QL16_PSEPJ|nr:hypothetical protein PPERSA_11985 [Pseudocohnilembus persalinus]|eukprot:KRX02645.1 hypothetical protein PPERSA_11985 [Pseudocohnilembus persalinus]